MSEDSEEDLDSFLLGGYGSDVTTSGQPRHGRSRSRQERRPESRERRSSLSSSSPRNNPLTTASQAGAESISKGVQKKRVTGRNGREQQNLDREMELTLSSSDDDDNTATQKSCLKPPPTSATQSPHSGKTKKGDGHYQAGDEVEARFGGRSKWFAGKVTLAYSRDAHVGEVYDIAYDDGDTEEAVLAARVRRPGQSPPSPRTGVAIDVKLARKGKGYHPAVIGRVNDDGTLYVKLDDGDAEWSVPVQQVIAHYSFEPAAALPRNSSNSLKLQHDNMGRAGGAGGENRERNVEQHPTPGTAQSTDNTTSPKSPPCVPLVPTPREQENVPVAGTLRGPAEASLSTNHGPTSRASKTASPTRDAIDRVSQATMDGNIASTPANDYATVAPSAPPADEQPEEDGSGLSWIADVAKSVGGSTLRSPGATPDMVRGVSTVESVSSLPTSGLLPTPVVTPPPGASAAATVEGQLSPRSVTPTHPEGRPTANASTTPSRTFSSAVAAAAETAENSAPGSVTPVHLEWKPNTDRSANRRWGAPPPETSHLLNTDQPPAPRLSADMVPPTVAYRASEHAVESSVDGIPSSMPEEPYAQDVEDRESTAVRRGALGSEAGSGVVAEERNTVKPAKLGECIPGETNNNGGTDPDADDAVATEGGGMETKSASNAPGASPLSNERAAGVAELGDASDSKAVVDGKNSRTSWDTLRASVQHRYAIEAMHLSEEVRLLKAKLKAASENTRAKLRQQEHKLLENVEGVLDRERENMKNALSRERMASARRIAALDEELETVKRRLEAERSRNSNHMPTGIRKRSLQRPTTAHSFFGNGCVTSNTTKKERAVRQTKARTIASSGKCGPSSGGTPILAPRERRPQPLPPAPPPRLLRREQQMTAISALRNKSAFDDPFSGMSLVPEDGSADDLAVERFTRLLLDALESRDESIKNLVVRVRCLERQNKGLGVPHRPLRGEGSVEHEVLTAEGRAEGENISLEGTGEATADAEPPPLPARDPPTPGRIDRHCAVSGGASSPFQPSSLPFCRGYEKLDGTGPVATSQLQQSAPSLVDHQYHDRDHLRWKLELERRDMRRRLDWMKSEMERVIGQFRGRTERAEAKAASAEERARTKALRYFEKKG